MLMSWVEEKRLLMLGFSATMLKCNQQSISDKCDLVGVLPQAGANNPQTLFVPTV